MYEVTNDGVIMVSVQALLIATVADPAEPPAETNAGDSVKTLTGYPLNDVAHDVIITAIDEDGGRSVLQARFFLACGEQVA